jgi:RNA-directed DNA polymerase
LQRRIAKDVIVGTHTFADCVHGGIKGRSARSNAEQHLRQPCLVTIDVRQFFPHVRHDQVYRMFRTEVGCGRDVARLLTRLVTLDDALPQGAPTSVAVANLLLDSALDVPITERAAATGTIYTRFIDDVGLSGLNPQQLIQEVARRLSRRRLSVHRLDRRPNAKSKLKIQPANRPQVITGLLVNGPHVSVPKSYRDNVRAAVHGLTRIEGPAARAQALTSIKGKIRYVQNFNPGAAKRLTAQLERQLATA